MELDIQHLSMALRQAFVKELLGERHQEYEGRCDIDYTSEAKKFLEPDFYTSGLGNTMPLALATALQLPIAIFSTDTTRSTMYVSPVNVTSTATSFVVTIQAMKDIMLQHYHSIITLLFQIHPLLQFHVDVAQTKKLQKSLLHHVYRIHFMHQDANA